MPFTACGQPVVLLNACRAQPALEKQKSADVGCGPEYDSSIRSKRCTRTCRSIRFCFAVAGHATKYSHLMKKDTTDRKNWQGNYGAPAGIPAVLNKTVNYRPDHDLRPLAWPSLMRTSRAMTRSSLPAVRQVRGRDWRGIPPARNPESEGAAGVKRADAPRER